MVLREVNNKLSNNYAPPCFGNVAYREAMTENGCKLQTKDTPEEGD